MSNIFKNFLDSMRLMDEFDEEDMYDELDEEKEEVPRRSRRATKAVELEEPEESINAYKKQKKERVTRVDRSTNSKVIPMKASPRGLEVCIMKPTTFEESQEICDMLLSGRATVINLEGFDDKLAQRTMDFVSGCVYAINGKLHRISSSIFIVSPDNVDISGDYLDLIKENGFEPPELENQF